jgi:hypothetical protein
MSPFDSGPRSIESERDAVSGGREGKVVDVPWDERMEDER